MSATNVSLDCQASISANELHGSVLGREMLHSHAAFAHIGRQVFLRLMPLCHLCRFQRASDMHGDVSIKFLDIYCDTWLK